MGTSNTGETECEIMPSKIFHEYYEDKGCAKAKSLGYKGKCLKGKEPACPFKKCLEDLTRKEFEKIKSDRKRRGNAL